MTTAPRTLHKHLKTNNKLQSLRPDCDRQCGRPIAALCLACNPYASVPRTNVSAYRPVPQSAPPGRQQQPARDRSEEHTSELQSLMRHSYAVFCLKKKKKTSTKVTSQ